MALNRFSSRRHRLYDAFLGDRLKGAVAYDRIAGYFQSSLLGLAGQEFKAIKQVRIVCNTEVSPADVHAIRQATGPRRAELEAALLRMVWNDGRFPHLVDVYGEPAKERLRVLQDLVLGDSATGRTFEIRIVPDCEFGFVHGKAGVMRYANGKATSFIGSANDTERAWSRNYELVWEDDTTESILWVQEEFDALWDRGFPVSDFIVKQIGRLPAYRYRPWTPAEDAFLGTTTDRQLARRLGRLSPGVAARRESLRIPKWAYELRVWTIEEELLVGTAPDHEIATRLKRTFSSVYGKRRLLGIPPAPWWPQKWTKRQLKLLGKQPDPVVARLTGRSLDAVRQQRLEGQIPGRGRKQRRWTAAQDRLLGTKPDKVLARRWNRSIPAIKTRKSRLGIKRGVTVVRYWKKSELAVLRRPAILIMALSLPAG